MRVIDLENINYAMRNETQFLLRCEEVFHDKIRAAAAEGLRIDYNAGRGHVIRCRKAANVSGWITAVTEAGSIIRAWAGEFTVAGEVRA